MKLIYAINNKCFILLFILAGINLFFVNRISAQCSSIDFSSNYNKGCLPTLVKFTATGIPSGSTVYWDFGSGKVSGGATMLETFYDPGVYDVTLEVKLPDGTVCTKYKPSYLVFTTLSEPSFGASDTLLCTKPNSIFLTDSTKNVSKREWYIDGSLITDTARTISYTFTSNGYKSVTLKVFDNNGCSKVLTKNNYIHVKEDYVLYFCSRLTENSTHTSITATFAPYVDPTIKNITEYTWDFPGGTPSTYTGLTPPTVTYNSYNAPHDVTFSIKTKDGCIAKFTKKALIRQYYVIAKNTYCEVEKAIFKINKHPNYKVKKIVSTKKLTYTVKDSTYTITFREAGNFDIKLGLSYTNSTCSDTLVLKDLFIVGAGRADFKIDNPTQCTLPATVKLTSLYTTPIGGTNTYTWEITDSLKQPITGSPFGPSTDSTLSYTFYEEGVYTVKLTTINSGGCSATTTKAGVIRIAIPIPEIVFPLKEVCAGTKYRPLNYSSPKAASAGFTHTWILRNRDSSKVIIKASGRTPTFTLKVPGTYDVEYSISNGPDTNCRVTKIYSNAFTVNGVLADFTVGARKGCLPFTTELKSIIKFSKPDSGAGSNLTYLWQATPKESAVFTDSTAANTVLSLTDNGCYTIKLTIVNGLGCSTVVSKKNFICNGTVANFTLQEGGCKDQDIPVVNKSQLGPDYYRWQVEPSTGVTISPSATAKNPTFRFAADGCYQVKLVTGKKADVNCEDSTVKTICIKAPTANFFSKDTIKTCAPVLVQFTSTSINADSFYWDFGDGNTLYTTDSTPIHTYDRNNAKGFTVKLVAIRKYGCKDSIILPNYIKVFGPEPSFTMDKKKGCESVLVNFTNTSSSVRNFFMSYGDNSAIDSNKISPHQYTFNDTSLESAIFYPTMYAVDDLGCLSKFKDSVIIYRPPVADFSIVQSTACTNQPIQVINKSKFATKYEWDFNNDGVVDDTNKNPVIIFTETGWKTISLTLTTKNGCTKTLVKNNIFYVYEKPESKFVQSKTIACAKDEVDFAFSGTMNSSISRYHWDFGETNIINDTSNLKDPTYSFISPGNHKILLTVYNKNGCSDTFSRMIFTPDTFPPATPEIYFVTVTSDNNVRVVYNATDSADFGQYHIYQFSNGPGTLVYSSTHINDTDAISTLVNVFARPYCFAVQAENGCGLKSANSKQHCTMHLDVMANTGVSNKLKWTPYQGWTNVSAYEIYRKVDNDSFRLHATMASTDSMFIDSQLCDKMYTYYVRALHPNGKFSSISNRDSLRPAYIYQLDPIEIYSTTVVNNTFTYTSWKPSEQPNVYMYLVSKYTSGVGWQPNYKFTKDNFITDSLVDVQTTSYQYQVRVVDQCGNVSPISNPGTSILLNADVRNDKRYLSWNSYGKWNAGVKEYLVQMQDNNNTFQTIDYVSANDTMYIDDSVYDYINGPTCYRVIALENAAASAQDSSTSNERCALLPARIFIPNAFTPNGDGHNDTFKVESVSLYKNVTDEHKNLQFTLRIFSRMGTLIFETHDVHAGWDGTFNGKESPMDTYVYTIDAHGLEGSYFYLDGTVHLIR